MTLEEKLANAAKVEIHYKPPHETKYAVVRYYCRKGKPLKVASYFIYGEELKTGKPMVCWHWQPSTNFNVIEDGFDMEEEATARMKELRSEE
ncbi:MAG: hypothetical protein IJV71_06990 [Lachnospiraceae bacterium]|nr:hypothetical protein [Lachnospiraceae bacterium]